MCQNIRERITVPKFFSECIRETFTSLMQLWELLRPIRYTFQVLLLSHTPLIQKFQTISDIQHNNAQTLFPQTSSHNEIFLVQSSIDKLIQNCTKRRCKRTKMISKWMGRNQFQAFQKRSILSEFLYRHSTLSIFRRTISVMKGHNIWLKHCTTTR
jgi:hypothetical protein